MQYEKIEKQYKGDATNMNEFTYEVVEERYRLGDHERISYGIAVYSTGNSAYDEPPLISVHDITSNRPLAAESVKKFNALGLSPCQLEDVIEDLLLD